MIDLPAEYPEETIYSLVARHAERYQYPSYQTTMYALFNVPRLGNLTAFPSQLGYLANSLPPGHDLTLERLLAQHTLLPYHAPFLPEQKLAEMLVYMRGGQEEREKPRMSSRGARSLPDWLRYCPLCAAEDRLTYGEAYWHRVHQLLGVFVCPRHAVFLEDSPVPYVHVIGGHPYNRRLITAEEVLPLTPPRQLEEGDRVHALLLRLAQDAASLLAHGCVRSRYNTIYTGHRRGIRLLIDRPERSGTVHEVSHVFAEFYPPAFLEMLQLPTKPQEMDWIRDLFFKAKSGEPVKHLLLINLWQQHVPEFLEEGQGQKPFGDPPWPCLNPAADHYREKIISASQVEIEYQKGVPVATFSCSCGYCYRREGPDLHPADIWRIDSLAAFGRPLETALKEKWGQESLAEIRQFLGDSVASRYRLPLLAEALGIKDERPASLPKRQVREFLQAYADYTGDDLRLAYRSAWLGLCAAYPAAPQSALRAKGRMAYTWLKKHDPAWLEAHEPARPNSFPPVADWYAQDEEIASHLRRFAERELTSSKHPVRITYMMLSTEIELEVGRRMPAHETVQKMPLSRAVVEEIMETPAQYAARRILWWARNLREQQQSYTRTDLFGFAAVSGKMRGDGLVQAALDEALAWQRELWRS